MALFLSTFTNRIDKKGRLSVPASFRNALSDQAFQGIVVFRSHHYPCLEGFGWDFVEEMGRRMDHFDLFSDAQDDLATSIFSDCVQLPFDGDGRIVLPGDLIDFCGVAEQATFVGMGRKFQIWDKAAFDGRKAQARDNVKKQGMTLPKQGPKGGDA